MTPEFPRPERVDTIGPREREIAVEADVDERAGLARRFGLLSLDRLEAAFELGNGPGRRDAALRGGVLGDDEQGNVLSGGHGVRGPVRVKLARLDEPMRPCALAVASR